MKCGLAASWQQTCQAAGQLGQACCTWWGNGVHRQNCSTFALFGDNLPFHHRDHKRSTKQVALPCRQQSIRQLHPAGGFALVSSHRQSANGT